MKATFHYWNKVQKTVSLNEPTPGTQTHWMLTRHNISHHSFPFTTLVIRTCFVKHWCEIIKMCMGFFGLKPIWMLWKFIYSEKATKFCEISTLLLSVCTVWVLNITCLLKYASENLINNPRMFNVETDDLAVKPYIPQKNLLLWICCKFFIAILIYP